ncbi:MAG: disulfide bond formation protein B, partial [Caulobacteraceae bacterium]|nr:disulfide bond formation protein B [Caulobacter sp.]
EVLQVVGGEIPCPLCLIERVAMLGAALAPILQLRRGWSPRHTGLGLLFALFLLVVSVRQVLLDICPRPGHDYVGSAVLGLHMPVWSVVIAAGLIAAFALELALFDPQALRAARPAPALARAGLALAAWIVALALANLAGTILQCGLGQCHTTGYLLLPGAR